MAFLGTAAKGSRVLPGTLRSLAAPMFEIVLRAAATAPPELKADTKQAMQLLAVSSQGAGRLRVTQASGRKAFMLHLSQALGCSAGNTCAR